MQFSQKTFGSQNTIKQLYRQYSTTFKNNEPQKNVAMTQSSNLPFDKIYNAFNSTGHMKNLTLDRFRHSQAKSIIEKLMQTKQLNPDNKEDEFALLHEIQNLQGLNNKGPIPLSKTEQKIFSEVVNLISEISEIKQKTMKEKDLFMKLKLQLKNEGIEFPQVEQGKKQLNLQTFKKYTAQELEAILQSNEKLQADIQQVTKQIANKNPQRNPESLLHSLINDNSLLKKQLSHLKSEIINAGQVDDKDLTQLNLKIQDLKRTIFILEQKRLGKLTDKDEQLNALKLQNQKLRSRTIQILGKQAQPISQRRTEVIQILKRQEEQKLNYAEQVKALKNKYENLLIQNQKLKIGASNHRESHYEGPLQVESKVSPFQNIYGEYQSVYGPGKQNYFHNYEPQRIRKTQYITEQQFSPRYNKEGSRNRSMNQNLLSYVRNQSYEQSNYGRSPSVYY